MIKAEAPESVAEINDCLSPSVVSWRPKIHNAFVEADRFLENVGKTRCIPACPKAIRQLL
jgi:hypothetical protein